MSGALGRAQAPTRFSHAVVFVFPTIWEPRTGYTICDMLGSRRNVDCRKAFWRTLDLKSFKYVIDLSVFRSLIRE